MTEAERNAISSPANGLIIYQTNGTSGLYFNSGDHVTPDWNHVTDEDTPQGYWTQDGTLLYYNDGNVGIGTATPAVPLDVVGAAQVSGTMQVGGLQMASGASNGYVLTSDGSGNATWQAAAGADGDWTVNGNDVYSAVSGNVGIGTSTPGNKLHVQGDARITGALQLDDGASNGYVLSSDASGNASWADVDGLVTNDADWEINGNNMYSTPSGNVGIGTSTPAAKLDVNGSALFVDSVYVGGRPGKIRIQGEQGYYPVLHYEYRDTTKFNLYHQPKQTGFGSDYLILSSFESVNALTPNSGDAQIIGFNPEGRIFQDYQGASAAKMIFSDANFPVLYIDAWGLGSSTKGIQSRVQDPTADELSVAISGFNKGEGSAVYGGNTVYINYGYLGTDIHGVYGENEFTDFTRTVENRGHFGSSSYGAFGETDINTVTQAWGALGLYDAYPDNDTWGVYGSDGGSDPNFGGIGTEDYGVYGEYNSENFYGILGSAAAAVYGRLGGTSQNLDEGDYAVKGIGIENDSYSGSDYSYGDNIGGVMGYNFEGTAYSFGVSGYTESDPANRAGGVLGAFYNANEWGALGYEASGGTHYGGYFTATETSGTDFMSAQAASGIGIGVYGDLFGAHISGQVYGLYASGENYGIYANGDVYRTGADVHLQENASGQNTVMYTLVTTEMTVQTYGIGELQNGKSSIGFDRAFSDVVSSDEPIIVTITPIGQTKGVYLEQVDASGFAVGENNNGKSNVQFTWIAIGKRAGFENMILPEDVVSSDYNNKIRNGLANDNSDQNAEGLYYQDGILIKGHVPETSPLAIDKIVDDLPKHESLTKKTSSEQAAEDEKVEEDLPGRK